jgi:hypothetical protein
MTVSQFCRLPLVAKQLAIRDVIELATALSKELGCKPHEALYALEPNNEPMEG